MLAFKDIPGFRMIEFAWCWVPADQSEIDAVVFGVALDAFRRLRRLCNVGGMQSAPREDPAGEILVAFHAAKLTLSGADTMARGALRGAADGAMRLGDRPG